MINTQEENHLVEEFRALCHKLQQHTGFTQDNIFYLMQEIHYLQEHLEKLDEKCLTSRLGDKDKIEPYFWVPADSISTGREE